jgi:limonene-1,2-epoxide hydrolase
MDRVVTAPDEFVERFAAAWADPDPRRLSALLHPDVRLVQPLEGEVRGTAKVDAMWRRTFGLMPDLRGQVLRWAERDGFLVIELHLSGTLGRRRIEWITSDHIRLEDGLVKERVAHFDPTPLVTGLVRTPSAWPRAARLRLSRD